MPANIHESKIVIIDFGSQYTQLIARRVRECGVYCEIMGWSINPNRLHEFSPQGIILSGGPESVVQGAQSPQLAPEVLELGVPILGICYGLQTLIQQLGGRVEPADKREFGQASLRLEQNECDLFAEDSQRLNVWMSHGDQVSALPPGFVNLGSTPTCPHAAVYHPDKRLYGLQFHPEVTHTEGGADILVRFVRKICGCASLWKPSSIILDAITQIRQKIGEDQVILGLSGGVDSAVVALLLHRAIGDRLRCIFVDNGLLRLNEGREVMDMFAGRFGLNILRVDAADRFLAALGGIADPEEKRKIIGRVFMEIFHEEALKLPEVRWVAQGTIYPDVIESAAAETGKAHVIKSHHNVGGLPADMRLGLLEPLRELFKDEVRKIGAELGLPADMLGRHPFPGPGLGVRILGEVKEEYCALLRRADAIFIDELRKAGWYQRVSQAFAVFLPVRSVGVMGDARKYDWVIALRAVETLDFMTARCARLPYELVETVSGRIINELAGISRVVYDISSKPPATIEWE